jgi:hypothetical protein
VVSVEARRLSCEGVVSEFVWARTWERMGFSAMESQMLMIHRYRQRAELFLSVKGEGFEERSRTEFKWSEYMVDGCGFL